MSGVTTTQREVFTTTDGTEFTTLEAAEASQHLLDAQPRLDSFLEQFKEGNGRTRARNIITDYLKFELDTA